MTNHFSSFKSISTNNLSIFEPTKFIGWRISLNCTAKSFTPCTGLTKTVLASDTFHIEMKALNDNF
uniref:Candidate secreted effector n=1 Tax=Meloidogyne incognita TaxID=6306 RepID=A0A914MH60_MELIC